MKRALICGVSGQDGAYLAKLLLDKGYEVVGTSRDAQVARFENLSRLGILDRVKLESMSMGDFRSVFQVVRKWIPRELYNLSGQSSVALSFEQPVETFNSIVNGSVNLLEAIRFTGEPIRYYNASSSECFGNVEGRFADESTPFRPRSQGYKLFACNGILFNHESPLRPERFVTRKITRAVHRIARGSSERLKLGNLTVRRDWGWAPEYVDAIWRMLQQEKPDDFVVATGTLSSLEEFVAAAFAAEGLDWHDHVSFDAALSRPTDLVGFAGDAGRAAQQLDWTASVRMPEVAARMVSNEQ